MKHLILLEGATFKEAIKRLDYNGNGFLAIINNNNKLVGILTDGDIRRAILNGETILDNIINKTPYSMHISDSRKSILYELRKSHLRHMPIIDDNMILKDIVILDNDEVNIKPNWVVIMAGGLGTRLGKLTENIAKPMISVGGKPMLEHIIHSFILHGYRKFMISVNYKSDTIKTYFKNGLELGVEIIYLEEVKKLGTAGSLSLINVDLTEPFFAINGDVLSAVDFDKMLEFHNSNNAVATMCVKEEKYQIPYGVIDTDDNCNILNMHEKPAYSYNVNTGIYVFSVDLLKYVPHNSFLDMNELFNIVRQGGGKAIAHKVRDYWADLGRPEDLFAADEKFSIK